MQRIISSILIVPLLIVLFSCQLPKPEVKRRISEWYQKQGDSYDLTITDAIGKISRYHPERADEEDDLIVTKWKGMTVTLAFKKPMKDIKWTVESLQENLSFYVLDDIYHDIESDGWEIYPRTPISSNSEGLRFTQVNKESISFKITWETYTVFGYSKTNACQEELEIADSTMPKECYVGLEKRLPLNFEFQKVRIK